MDLPHRLYELRRQAGLSQEELAHLLGVTRQAVQKWEAGTSRPDMDNLTALADQFQVSLDYLVRGTQVAAPERETTVVNHYYYGWRYEYKSKRTLFGLPLVHIKLGRGLCWARGIIAIGNVATGVAALGCVSAGLLSLGGAALGLLALGGCALGGMAVGGVAIGLAAWGGVSVGVLAVGGVACGQYAAGGVALGTKAAVGGVASAPLAIGTEAEGAQRFLTPLADSQLPEVRRAIEGACRGAPGWVARLLYEMARRLT